MCRVRWDIPLPGGLNAQSYFSRNVALGTSSVLAADLPSEKGAPVYAPAPPILSWTGVYVGGQVGIQWGQTNWDRFDPTNTVSIASELPYANKGVVGGGHIGYNYQVSQFVFGVEGNFQNRQSAPQ